MTIATLRATITANAAPKASYGKANDMGKQMKLYKVLNTDGSAYHGGAGSWHLPKGERPGKWMPAIVGEIVPCRNGYHLCRETDLLDWLGPAIFEAEYEGKIIEVSDKVVVRNARLIRPCGGWNEKTARLFAADCAERVLPIFEKKHPNDDRPRQAINAARAYARGEIDDAAWAAAWAAADAVDAVDAAGAAADAADAAGAAVWAAADAADAADAAGAAADAARAAAWAAADAADAADAAGAAEQEWQCKRFLQYLTGEIQ